MSRKTRMVKSEPIVGELLSKLDESSPADSRSVKLELTTTLDPLGFLGRILSVYAQFRTEQNRIKVMREQIRTLERCATARVEFEREESRQWRMHETRIEEARAAHEKQLAKAQSEHQRTLLREHLEGELRLAHVEAETEVRQLRMKLDHQMQTIQAGLDLQSQLEMSRIEKQLEFSMNAIECRLEERREELAVKVLRLESMERTIDSVFAKIEEDDQSWKAEQKVRLQVFRELSGKYHELMMRVPPPSPENLFMATELMKTLSGDLISLHQMRVTLREQQYAMLHAEKEQQGDRGSQRRLSPANQSIRDLSAPEG